MSGARCCSGDWPTVVKTSLTGYTFSMAITYSAYDAKARFSEVLRQVREGKTVTVSYRGKPVAEIRAIRESPATIEARLDDLGRQGILVGSGETRESMKPVVRRPGTLKRFLAERGE